MNDLLKPWRRQDFWEIRFCEGFTPWDLGEVHPALSFLETQVGWDRQSPTIFPGAGAGSDSFHFASLGYEVSAVDWSPSAIDEIRALSQRKRLPMEVLRKSLWELPPNWHGSFKYWVENTFFCAIDVEDRPKYIQACRDLLKKDGELIGLFFIQDDFEERSIMTAQGGGLGPPFYSTSQEIREAFGELFEIVRLEEIPKDQKRHGKISEWCGHFRRKS